MSERRMLQIIGDTCRMSPGNEADVMTIGRKYGRGYAETLRVLTKRGYINKYDGGRISLTAEGRSAAGENK